ncbi:hypothetical protein E8E11_002225 [Didymella keratinophila]|nr:hypothetical protein E8E11_002225 [Didymella keratinophila]
MSIVSSTWILRVRACITLAYLVLVLTLQARLSTLETHSPYSPFISVSDNSLATAKRARDYHAGKCMKNKQKPSLMVLVKVSTEGLIPAILKRSGFPDMLVWVDVWLIADTIPQSRVVEVLPCQGSDIIHNKGNNPKNVRERVNGDTYRWSWHADVWKKSKGRLHAKIEPQQKRSWEAHELEAMRGVDWSAKAQRQDYRSTRRDCCWTDPETMTTKWSDELGEDDRKEDGARDKEVDGQGEVVKQAITGDQALPLESPRTDVETFQGSDYDSWYGFSDEDSSSREDPV